MRESATVKLMRAVSKDNEGSRADYIRVLISEGADVNATSANATSANGRTPLMYAASNSKGKSAEIKQLLIDAGVEWNGSDESFQPSR